MNSRTILSTSKIADESPNEDSAVAEEKYLAVSDGAGGCGIFAKEWSQYLLDKLPDFPFADFANFTAWTDSIWEEFYQTRVAEMGKYGNLVANKFNNEGSLATLTVAWLYDERIEWRAYGDSGLFVLNKQSGEMRFIMLEDIACYEANPMLLNWKDLPKESAYKAGSLDLQEDDIVLIASDALACHLTMAYYAYTDNPQIDKCASGSGKLKAIAGKMIEHIHDLPTKSNFYKDCLEPLLHHKDGPDGEEAFRTEIKRLYDGGLITDDDFSLVVAW